MRRMSEPIVFFGNERLATGVSTTAPTLKKLISAGYTIAAVVANDEGTVSRKQRTLEVAEVAREHSIPVLIPKRLRDIQETLSSFGAQAGVLVAYGKIVPQSIIDLFPRGIINIHPSLLPLHRGPTPIESVILDGSTQTGVSLMQLVKAMDAGPTYAQQSVSLTGHEAKQDLADRLLDLGGTMLLEILPRLLDGSAVKTMQDDGAATYDSLISKDESVINWHKPAYQIEREIRAFKGWPGSSTVIAGKDVVVTQAHVVDQSGTPGTFTKINKQLVAFCGENALVIDLLKPAGKKEMTGQAFLAGHKNL